MATFISLFVRCQSKSNYKDEKTFISQCSIRKATLVSNQHDNSLENVYGLRCSTSNIKFQHSTSNNYCDFKSDLKDLTFTFDPTSKYYVLMLAQDGHCSVI